MRPSMRDQGGDPETYRPEPEIAAFLVGGEVVYARQLEPQTHSRLWQPRSFAIHGGRPPTNMVFANGLPAAVQAKVEFLATRLCSRFTMFTTDDDFEDLVSELTVEVIRAMRNFDPRRGREEPFLRGALNFIYQNKLRSIRRQTDGPQFLLLNDDGVVASRRLEVVSHEFRAALKPVSWSIQKVRLSGTIRPLYGGPDDEEVEVH